VHVPDMTSWSLTEAGADGAEIPIDLLEAWAREVTAIPGVRWRGPADIRVEP
jgi:hypothetical protein